MTADTPSYELRHFYDNQISFKSAEPMNTEKYDRICS